jgi:hypothetical protein
MVLAADRLEVLGGLGNVQLAARTSRVGWLVVGEAMVAAQRRETTTSDDAMNISIDVAVEARS